MNEASADQPGGIGGLHRAYFRRHYTILFYSLLFTMVAAPLSGALGLGASLMELFLAINVLAAVIPFGSRSGRRLLFGILITAFVSPLQAGSIRQRSLRQAA